jgi:hypothetical protein
MPSSLEWRRQLKRTLNSKRLAITCKVNRQTHDTSLVRESATSGTCPVATVRCSRDRKHSDSRIGSSCRSGSCDRDWASTLVIQNLPDARLLLRGQLADIRR